MKGSPRRIGAAVMSGALLTVAAGAALATDPYPARPVRQK